MDNKTAWDTLEKITNLPTLPAVYFQVNKLLQDKQASIEKIARIIEVDPGMSSSILRLVNSAFYGLGKTCNSISHAVMILGFNAVKNAIVSVTVLDALTVKDRPAGFNTTDFWRHSVSVAVLARQLAQRSRLAAPEDAFIAGLLHDAGKIILLNYFKDDFLRILQAMRERNLAFADAEQEVASLDHVQIGAYLARKWQMPDPIVEAIACHHYYVTQDDTTGLVECVIAANMLASSNYSVHPDDIIFEGRVEDALKPLLAAPESWLPAAVEEIDAACEFFLEKR